MTFRRWLLTELRGPLCDYGTAWGVEGCLEPSVAETLPRPAEWSRGFRWCEKHKDKAREVAGFAAAPAGEKEGR